MPSPMEQKCLQHLDAPGSWAVLRTDKPDETDVLSWRPFRRVFAFNFVLFGIILTGIFLVLETKAGARLSDIEEDLPYGLGAVALLAATLGLYVTHLYRRSWNGRARSLRRAEDDPGL